MFKSLKIAPCIGLLWVGLAYGQSSSLYPSPVMNAPEFKGVPIYDQQGLDQQAMGIIKGTTTGTFADGGALAAETLARQQLAAAALTSSNITGAGSIQATSSGNTVTISRSAIATAASPITGTSYLLGTAGLGPGATGEGADQYVVVFPAAASTLTLPLPTATGFTPGYETTVINAKTLPGLTGGATETIVVTGGAAISGENSGTLTLLPGEHVKLSDPFGYWMATDCDGPSCFAATASGSASLTTAETWLALQSFGGNMLGLIDSSGGTLLLNATGTNTGPIAVSFPSSVADVVMEAAFGNATTGAETHAGSEFFSGGIYAGLAAGMSLGVSTGTGLTQLRCTTTSALNSALQYDCVFTNSNGTAVAGLPYKVADFDVPSNVSVGMAMIASATRPVFLTNNVTTTTSGVVSSTGTGFSPNDVIDLSTGTESWRWTVGSSPTATSAQIVLPAGPGSPVGTVSGYACFAQDFTNPTGYHMLFIGKGVVNAGPTPAAGTVTMTMYSYNSSNALTVPPAGDIVLGICKPLH